MYGYHLHTTKLISLKKTDNLGVEIYHLITIYPSFIFKKSFKIVMVMVIPLTSPPINLLHNLSYHGFLLPQKPSHPSIHLQGPPHHVTHITSKSSR